MCKHTPTIALSQDIMQQQRFYTLFDILTIITNANGKFQYNGKTFWTITIIKKNMDGNFSHDSRSVTTISQREKKKMSATFMVDTPIVL